MKNKKHRWLLVFVLFILVIAAGCVGWLFLRNQNSSKASNDETVVKKNVRILTSKMEKDQLPVKVTNDTLVFEKNPKYKKGQVIVAGIIEGAEYGFIRRVTDIEHEGDTYTFYTEPALLTDVFEKAHILKRFKITDNGLQEVAITSDQSADATRNGMVQTAVKTIKPCNAIGKILPISDESKFGDPDKVIGIYDHTFDCDLELDSVKFEGEVNAKFDLELRLDIEEGKKDYIFGMALHTRNNVDLTTGLVAAMHSEQLDTDKKLDRKLWSQEFEPFETEVPIPLVITNEISANLKGSIDLEGEIYTSCKIVADNRLGFLYDSKKGVELVNEWSDSKDGLTWETGAKVSGSMETGVYFQLKSKIYDSTGLNCFAGIVGSADAEVKLTTDGSIGSLDAAIKPKIGCELVVEIPIIDKTLTTTNLVEKELQPLWSQHWESSQNWKDELDSINNDENLDENNSLSEDEGEDFAEPKTDNLTTGDKGNTYITRFGEMWEVECPTFMFRYPSEHWKVTTEEVGNGNDPIDEHVVLENKRGVTVSYWACESELGGDSRVMAKVEIEKVADSDFDPDYAAGGDLDFSESLGKMMVASVHVIGEMWPDEGEYFTGEDGATFYAVLPESREGTEEIQVQAENVDDFSFLYPLPYAFIAEAPDGNFTKAEAKEVIEILKSFTTQ